MADRPLKLTPTACVVLLMSGLLAGCGADSTVDTSTSASAPISNAQAVAYAHTVNLQTGDIPGFASKGREIEAPKPGPLALEEIRCSGAINPARKIARIESTEFSAGRGSHSELVKSAVVVWPTPALVAVNNGPRHRARSRVCFARFLRALNRRINLERKGQRQIGPFTITAAPIPLSGAVNGSLTRVDETRLLSTGTVRAHIYRDILGFTAGAAEFELEAIGFDHPVPAAIEVRTLKLLLDRATAHTVRSTAP
jgi:hypothetical protein